MTTDEKAVPDRQEQRARVDQARRSRRTSALKWEAAGAGLGILLAAFGLVAAGDAPGTATEPALTTPAITRTTSASTTLRQSPAQARVRVRTRQS